MTTVSCNSLQLSVVCYCCRVSLKTNSGLIKKSWENEVIKAEEELLTLKGVVNVAELPEKALLSFVVRVLL